jgi:RNA polymerase sigma factor (sigma-70 family)
MSTGPNDMEIISRILQGEVYHFAELVNRYQNYVYTLTLRYIKNRQDAEEVAQDIFIKAHRSLPDFRGSSKFSTWLFTIVHTTCITFLRKKKHETYSLENEDIFTTANSWDPVYNSNMVEQKSRIYMVTKAIALLNPDDAEVITLFYKAEQSLEEISEILGLETNTVKVRLHRARIKLKDKMEKHFPQEIKDLN